MSVERVEELDRELARLARISGGMRLQIGLVLDALGRSARFIDLGFPTLKAYALERAERSGTWVRQSTFLARKASELPVLRAQLISGGVSWSMALEVSRVATPETEADWLFKARNLTVAGMKKLVKEHLRLMSGNGDDGDDDDVEADEPTCTLTITANDEDQWALEAARLVANELGVCTSSDVLDAMIGEALSTLLPLIPRTAGESDVLVPDRTAENAWRKELARWRAEAESRCEPRIPKWDAGSPQPEAVTDFWALSHDALDAEVRRLSAALEERDLVMGELAEEFHVAGGWRRLGYATHAQYARERLGMSTSSLEAKRCLAKRLRRLPEIRAAHRAHRIGYEATRLVAEVATPDTDALWAGRAIERTVVHLREDIQVARLLARRQRTAVFPPDEEAVNAVRQVKGELVSGAAFREGSAPADNTPEAVTELRAALVESLKTPPHLRALGRSTVQLRVSPEIRATYRWLEQLYLRHRPLPMTFPHFLAQSFLEENARERPRVAYEHIYERDGYRCINPMCGRQHVTPHHIVFKSRGGSDRPENIGSLCVECHLKLVHEGHITVTGEALNLTWLFADHTKVEGRRRRRVSCSARWKN